MARGARAARGCATGSRRRGRDRAETDAGEGLHRGRAGRCSFEARSAETRSLEEASPRGYRDAREQDARIGRAGSLERSKRRPRPKVRSRCAPRPTRRRRPPPDFIGDKISSLVLDLAKVAEKGTPHLRGPSPQPAASRFTFVRCYNDTPPESSARPRAFCPRRSLTNNPKRRERPSPSPPNGRGARLINRRRRVHSHRANPRSIVPSPIDADPPAFRSTPSTGRLTWARAGSG